MKVWLDDVRIPPDGWVWCKWPEEVITLLETGSVTELSLDHDLGNDKHGTGYKVVLWLEEAVITRGFCPPDIRVHSANGPAGDRMRAGIDVINRHSQR